MNWKSICVLSFIALLSASAYGANGDNAASPSSFEGVWSGTYQSGIAVTVTIGPRDKEGFCKTNYTWGGGRDRLGNVTQGGSFTGKGKEQGEAYVMEWKGKDGTNFDMKLEKQKDDVDLVNAKFSRSPAPVRGYPNTELFLRRR